MADHDALASQLLEFVPGATLEQAVEHLSANEWNLEQAAASLMADLEDGEEEAAAVPASTSQAAAPVPPPYTGPRTLDGRPAPHSVSAASSATKKPAKKKGIATLGSLAAGSGHGHGHDHDDDDSDDDDDQRGARDTYAGGERSGLAITDPSNRPADARRLINDIVAKAKSQTERPPPSDPAGPLAPSRFRGGGQTLGGDGVDSREIPDPRAPPATVAPTAPRGPVQERVLHLWRDGFSIDDGPLHRFDDPTNADNLRMIQQGRAPVHLMNVRYDEELDVKLDQHDENYKQLPKIYRPFGGEGRRLGSPVPGESTTSADAAPAAAPVAPSPLGQSSSANPAAASSTAVDESRPTIMIRIQMPDGTRLPARFNTTHTIGDVYYFISRASTELPTGWVLATTFPNKDHTEKELVLGEMAEFKKGGTAMVKKP